MCPTLCIGKTIQLDTDVGVYLADSEARYFLMSLKSAVDKAMQRLFTKEAMTSCGVIRKAIAHSIWSCLFYILEKSQS